METDKKKNFLTSILDIRDKRLFLRRTVICFIGVFGMGFFLSFLIMTEFGTDPCTFMNLAISSKLGLSLGNWQVLLNSVLLILVIILSRKLIGLGTLFNMVLIGYYADFFRWLWRKIIPESAFTDMPVRAVIFAVALIGFIISAAVYMKSESGVAPYDAIAQILADHLPTPFFLSRMIFDFSAILIGVLAGARPSIGHIFMAFGLGPVISIVGKIMGRFVGAHEASEPKS